MESKISSSKISSTGWFCILDEYSWWIPVFKLTEEQMAQFLEVKASLNEVKHG